MTERKTPWLHTSGRLNGCHDHAPYVETVVINRLATPSVSFKNVMTKDCQYSLTDLGKADSGCDGCVWRKPL